jgi:glucosamine kinase
VAVSLVVGVDGGATQARALVTDLEGRTRGRATAGAALGRPSEPVAVVPGLLALTRSAVEDAGAELPVAALCCALAGVGRERERDLVERALAGAGVAQRVRVVTDAEAALHDAFRDGPGIVLIAGTGSVAWGRGPDGRVARAGGWGALLGDEGSGYALGLGALRAVLRAHDGRARPTTLTGAVLRETGLNEAAELVRWAESR